MSRDYKFHNPEGVYSVSFAVVEWIAVFTRNDVDLKFLPHERIHAAAGGVRQPACDDRRVLGGVFP